MPRVGPSTENSVSKAGTQKPGTTAEKRGPTTQPETPAAKGWGKPADDRQSAALQQSTKTLFTAAKPADGASTAQRAIAEFMELRGDAPRSLAGTELTNEIGVAMHLPPNNVPKTPDDEKKLESGGWNFYGGKELDAIDTIAAQVRKTGGDTASMAVMPIIFDSKETGQVKLSLFRVQGKDGKEHFVDNVGRSYDSFDDWKKNNTLPPGKMTFPDGGHLTAGTDGQPKLTILDTPKTPDTFLKKAEGVADKVALVGGLVLGAAAIIGTGGIATPLVVGAGVALSGWMAYRSGSDLVDRAEHGQTLGLGDAQARSDWLSFGASVTGVGAMGAAGRVGAAVSTAGRASEGLVNTAATLNVASQVTGTALVAEQGVDLVTNWKQMSNTDRLMALSQMAFFGGGVYKSAQTAGGVRNLYSFSAIKEGLLHPEANLSPEQQQLLKKALAKEGGDAAPKATPKNAPLKLHEVEPNTADARFKIVTNDPALSSQQAGAMVKILGDALHSDMARDRWSGDKATAEPITIKVLTKDEYNKVGGDSAGITVDKNTFLIPADLAKKQLTPDDVDTLAHELSHVLDMRASGGQLHKIPSFIQEGKAYVNGAMYTAQKGLVSKETQVIHDQLGKLTADDAQKVLTDFRNGKAEMDPKAPLHKYETTGGLYMEFLRTRLSGKGMPDAMTRMSKVEEEVADGKAGFGTAFKKSFGVWPYQADKQFVDYIKATEGHPNDRLEGTVWQSAAQHAANPLGVKTLEQWGRGRPVWEPPKPQGEAAQLPVYMRMGHVLEDHSNNATQALDDALAKLTTAKAEKVLAGELKGDAADGPERLTGGLYNEFLRTKLNGKGDPDTVAKLDKIQGQLKDGKASWAQAFLQQFGISQEKANAQFLDYMRATEGKPAERLAGTVWEKSPISEPDQVMVGQWEKSPPGETLFHNGKPLPKDVNQGPLGNCWKLATDAVIAFKDSALLTQRTFEVGVDPKSGAKIIGQIFMKRIDTLSAADRAKLESFRAADNMKDPEVDEHGVHREYMPVWQLTTDKIFKAKDGTGGGAANKVRGQGLVSWPRLREKLEAAYHGADYRNIANGGFAAKAMEEASGRHSTHYDFERTLDPAKDVNAANDRFSDLLQATKQGKLTAMGSNGDGKNLRKFAQYNPDGSVAKDPYFSRKFDYADGDGNAASTGTKMTGLNSRDGAGWVGNHEYSVLRAYMKTEQVAQKGDTLASIAKSLYGDEAKASQLIAANPALKGLKTNATLPEGTKVKLTGDGIKMVTLRNPWGDVRPPEFADKNAHEDGIVEVPWYYAYALFGDMDIGGRASGDRGELNNVRPPNLPKGTHATFDPASAGKPAA